MRLSEVMAYADIPPSMRPALSEFDPVSMILGNSMQHGAGGGGAGAGGLANVKAAQVGGGALRQERWCRKGSPTRTAYPV